MPSEGQLTAEYHLFEVELPLDFDLSYRDVLTFLLATNGFPPGDELTMSSMEEIVIVTEGVTTSRPTFRARSWR